MTPGDPHDLLADCGVLEHDVTGEGLASQVELFLDSCPNSSGLQGVDTAHAKCQLPLKWMSPWTYPNSKKSVSLSSGASDLAYFPIICARYSCSCFPANCCFSTFWPGM